LLRQRAEGILAGHSSQVQQEIAGMPHRVLAVNSLECVRDLTHHSVRTQFPFEKVQTR
jgi:hypothetical protein